MAIDPTALSYLLAVTGPAALPGGGTISAANAVALTQSTVYTKFDDQGQRKEYLLEMARAADEKILGSSARLTTLLSAATKAASERRLLLWSRDPAVEAILEHHAIGGTVIATPAPYVQPVIINFAANKLDYYLKESVDWVAKGCGDVRMVTVTIVLTNTAPADLSTYVAQRTDDPPYPVTKGDNRLLLYYIGTVGGSLKQITVNGQVGTVQPGFAGSHPTYSTLVELPRGTSRTITLQLTEPARAGGDDDTPLVVRQPTVLSSSFSTRAATCG